MQGYPDTKLAAALIGYCFPLAMAATHLICCCGMFDAPRNDNLFRKANSGQIFSTFLILIPILSIYCDSSCHFSEITIKSMIGYLCISTIHLSFGMNPYLISHHNLVDLKHAVSYYILSPCLLCIELSGLLMVVIHCFTPNDEMNSVVGNESSIDIIHRRGFYWLCWYIASIPLVGALYFGRYVHRLFATMPFVTDESASGSDSRSDSRSESEHQNEMPLINWLMKQSSIKNTEDKYDRIYSIIHVLFHSDESQMQHKEITGNKLLNESSHYRKFLKSSKVHDSTHYVSLLEEDATSNTYKSMENISFHSAEDYGKCLKYIMRYTLCDTVQDKVDFIGDITDYNGLHARKWIFLLVYKLIVQLAPIYLFVEWDWGYGIDALEYARALHWVESREGNSRNLLLFALICMYLIALIFTVIIGIGILRTEYYYGYARSLIVQLNGQNKEPLCLIHNHRSHREVLDVQLFHDGFLWSRHCITCLSSHGLVLDVCEIVLCFVGVAYDDSE